MNETESERLEKLVDKMTTELIPSFEEMSKVIGEFIRSFSTLIQDLLDAGYTAEEIRGWIHTEDEDDIGRLHQNGGGVRGAGECDRGKD